MANKSKQGSQKIQKNKKANKKHETREIIIREGQHSQREVSHEEYYEGPSDLPAESAVKGKKGLSTKAIIRICIILLIAVLGLTIYFNRENFSPENLGLWFKTKLMGTGVGDGYPVSITGSGADVQNLATYDGNCAVLSDTTFILMNSTGKEMINLRHSYNSPSMSAADGRFLLYNLGGTGYSVVTAENEPVKSTATDKITAGAIAKNGRYMLALQPGDYASQLNVYLPTGELKAKYQFADGYVSTVAINKNGTGGAVAMVMSEGGRIYSRIHVFDFNKEDAVAQFQTDNNVITKLSYNNNGKLFAVGDKKAVYFDGGSEFTEYDYGGKTVTAYTETANGVMLSISGYVRNGACTVLSFSDSPEPTEFISEDFVNAISAHSGGFMLLTGSRVLAYGNDGKMNGTCDAGYDAKAIGIGGFDTVYILGVREIRYGQITS